MRTDHILIIRFSAIGDVAMTVPVVYSLAHAYPQIKITVLSRPYAKAFFENLADNVDFIEADLKEKYKGIRGLNKLYKELSSYNFTAIADLHDILRTKYLRSLFKISGKKVAHINKHREGKRKLTRKKNKILVQQPSSFDNYKEVFEKLGYTFDLNFTTILKENKNSIYDIVGEKKEKWIGIAPFATHQGKIYSLDKMKNVVSHIKEKIPNSRVFLFGGGEKEMNILNSWQASFDNVTNASAILGGIKNELLLMSELDVMLTMDSANAHLASLVDTKIITIWGCTHPFAGFKAWNQDIDNIIQRKLECRPCSVYGNKKCYKENYECMNIDENMIVEKIKNCVDKNVDK